MSHRKTWDQGHYTCKINKESSAEYTVHEWAEWMGEVVCVAVQCFLCGSCSCVWWLKLQAVSPEHVLHLEMKWCDTITECDTAGEASVCRHSPGWLKTRWCCWSRTGPQTWRVTGTWSCSQAVVVCASLSRSIICTGLSSNRASWFF